MRDAKLRRAVLVTGGTGTIGAEIVRALCAADEYSVVANFAHDATRARALRHETGSELHCADVRDEQRVAAMFDSIPHLFAVIHVAGIARDKLMVGQSHSDWEETLRTNCDGAFLVVREALRKLQNEGRLILFASRVGEKGRAGQTAYAASKAAAIALTKCAAREAAERGITVNTICPGFIPSAMNESLSTQAVVAARKESVFGQFGGRNEIVSLVQWLLSASAASVSGQVFHCDSRI